MALLGTLSPAGWITNPLEVADYLMAYFFLTQKSQTHFHPQYVYSYQSLIAENAPDNNLAAEIESKLKVYLSSEFTNVLVQVKIAGKDDDENNSEQTITIGCSFTSDGKVYSLSNVIELLGTNVKRIYRLNETGTLT